jgi:hypothetical protein
MFSVQKGLSEGVRHFTRVIFWESLAYTEDSMKLEDRRKVTGNKFYGVRKAPTVRIFAEAAAAAALRVLLRLILLLLLLPYFV